jgi:hypothetical protein
MVLHEQYVKKNWTSIRFHCFVFVEGYSQENWSDNGYERNQNIR